MMVKAMVVVMVTMMMVAVMIKRNLVQSQGQRMYDAKSDGRFAFHLPSEIYYLLLTMYIIDHIYMIETRIPLPICFRCYINQPFTQQ